MSGRFLGIARCSRGQIGIVTDHKEIAYPDGSSALAYTGWHVWPLRLLFRRWSSRTPRWIYR